MSQLQGVRKLTYLKLVTTALGLLYSIFQVRIFGTTPEIENYFAATSLVYLITSFTQSGQLAEIFLPTYLNIRASDGVVEAHRAFSVVINRLVIGVVILLLIGLLLSSILVKLMVPGFGPDQQIMVGRFFVASLPYIALTVTNSFVSSLLNAERAFGKSETAAVFSSIVSLVVLFVLSDSIGPWALLLSLYLGQTTELGSSILFLRKFKIKYSFIFKTEKFDHGNFFKNLKSTSVYVICTQIFTVALISSISYLPQGVFAIYRYTLQIFEKSFSILIMPLSTIFFTSVAESLSIRDFDAVRKKIVDNLEYGILISSAALAVVVVAGYDSIALIWSSKKFDIESVDMAYRFIIMWFLIFIMQTISLAYRRTSVSVNLTSKQYNLSSIGMIASAMIAYFAVRHFSVQGLFLSIVFSRALFLSVPIILIFYFKRDLVSFPGMAFLSKVIFILVLTAGAGYYLRTLLDGYFQLGVYTYLINSIFYGFFSILLFVGLSYIAKLKKVIVILNGLKKKLI